MSVCDRPPTHRALIRFVPVGGLVSTMDAGQALFPRAARLAGDLTRLGSNEQIREQLRLSADMCVWVCVMARGRICVGACECG